MIDIFAILIIALKKSIETSLVIDVSSYRVNTLKLHWSLKMCPYVKHANKLFCF